MKLPIPSFKDWLKTFWLLIQTILYAFIGTLVFYGFLAIAFIAENLWIAGIGFLACITVFPILFFTYVHYLLWGQRDAKRIVIFATAPSWKEGLWQWFIIFIACVGVLIFMLALFLIFSGIIFLVSALMNQSVGEDTGGAFTFGFFRGLGRSLGNALPERLIALPSILWLLIASEMMAWKRRMAQGQKTKLTATTSPLITIDDELDRLKAQIEEDKKKNP